MPIHRKYYPKTSQCIKLNDIIWFSPLKKKKKLKFKVSNAKGYFYEMKISFVELSQILVVTWGGGGVAITWKIIKLY